jgi:hypothetical protein
MTLSDIADARGRGLLLAFALRFRGENWVAWSARLSVIS